MTTKVIANIAGVAALGIGARILVSGGGDYINARNSADWPAAKGQVTESHVRRPTGLKRSPKPHVVFRYEIEGKRFTNDTILFGEPLWPKPGDGLKRSASSIVALYPKGRSVDVFYRPDRPQVAVLEKGVSQGAYVPLGIGALFFLAGMSVIVRAIRGKFSESK